MILQFLQLSESSAFQSLCRKYLDGTLSAPRRWTLRLLPLTVEKKNWHIWYVSWAKGLDFQKHLEALRIMRLDFNLAEVDLFCIARTLSHLHEVTRLPGLAIRSVLQLIGNTLIIKKRAPVPPGARQGFGYGTEFGQVFTSAEPGIPDGALHVCMIQNQ